MAPSATIATLPILLTNRSATVVEEAKRTDVQSAADNITCRSDYGSGRRGDGIRCAVIIAVVVAATMALHVGVLLRVLVIDNRWNELIAHDHILPRIVTILLREGAVTKSAKRDVSGGFSSAQTHSDCTRTQAANGSEKAVVTAAISGTVGIAEAIVSIGTRSMFARYTMLSIGAPIHMVVAHLRGLHVVISGRGLRGLLNTECQQACKGDAGQND
jgi:hypothetical protein